MIAKKSEMKDCQSYHTKAIEARILQHSLIEWYINMVFSSCLVEVAITIIWQHLPENINGRSCEKIKSQAKLNLDILRTT